MDEREEDRRSRWPSSRERLRPDEVAEWPKPMSTPGLACPQSEPGYARSLQSSLLESKTRVFRFGATREGFAFTDLRPPDAVPDPAGLPSFRDPPPEGVPAFDPMPFWEELVEGRPVLGHAPWEDYVPDRAERAMWYRFDEPPLLDDGRLDPLSLVVLADTMPGAVGERVGPSERAWFAPSVDLTVHLLDDCRSSWVLAHNRARHAGDGYASADMALWDCGDDGGATPRLVAYATQLFLFTFLPSPSPS